MRMEDRPPKWAKLPEKKMICCRICGKPVEMDDEYEVVQRRGKSVSYFHSECVRKEKNCGKKK